MSEFKSFRAGLWIYNNGVSAAYVPGDGYQGDYQFCGPNGWQKCGFNDELGFSDGWDKVSMEEAIAIARRDSRWTDELERLFRNLPGTFKEESLELEESVSYKTFSKLSERVQSALDIAVKAHKGQKDRAGKAYINHPMTVASKVMPDESAVIVALLHDVVEDTDITFADLKDFLKSEEMKALKLLTRRNGMDYMEYVKRIKGNPLATKVKLADLSHNSDISRIPDPSEKDMERLEKYKRAMEILRG